MLSVCATGDDGIVRRVAGAIGPVDEHTSVVLEKMMISVDLFSDRAEVDSTFLLHNTGDATSVSVTFPEAGELGAATGQLMSLGRFTLWADGNQLSSNGGRGGPAAFVALTPVRFAPDERRVVRIRYDTALATAANGRRFFEYVTGSAAAWKGTVHHCGITVDVHYEDRARECFEVPFGMYGQGHFESARGDFEPASTDQFRVWYSKAPVGVTVAGFRLGCEIQGSYPRPRDGRLWVAARRLAEWLNVRFEPLPGGVRLTRGGRVVTLMSGDVHLDVNGSRIRLPEAPRVERGRLMVPLRPVASALGVFVQWRPQAHRLEMSFPIDHALAEVLENADELVRTFRIRPRVCSWPTGWAPIEAGGHAVEAHSAPHLVTGHFTGGGFMDAALLLQRSDEYGLAVLWSWGGDLELVWAAQWRGTTGFDGLSFALRTLPPGKVAYYAENETTPRSGRLDLKHDGIELLADGKPTRLFYWDDTVEGRNKLRSVLIAK
jgi:hypothetical protein